MNIIEEIESIKSRIDAETREHWKQIAMLDVAARKIGHNIDHNKLLSESGITTALPIVALNVKPTTTAQTPAVQNNAPKPTTKTPETGPGYQKVKSATTTKIPFTKGAREKALRALAVGRITSRDVAKAVYGTDTKEAISRATVVLYNLEKLGRASSIVLDTDRTFARRKAWAITQKGKNFLDSKG